MIEYTNESIETEKDYTIRDVMIVSIAFYIFLFYALLYGDRWL
tara:strand:+ start:949 stop:1077 length:129 start_codon:yes stop_codon:yes gene_type:complete